MRSEWVEVIDLVQQLDVTALVETKIDNKVTTSSLLIPGYSTFRQDRTNYGRGVLTFAP